MKKHYSVVHKPMIVESLSKPDTTLQTTCNFATKDVVLGGNMLNDVFADRLDLPQNEFNHFNINLDNPSLLLDNEENLDFGNVKDLDHFNFEIDDNQKHFVCDLCFKPFTKLKRLVEHLKAHTGKFLCFKCLKVCLFFYCTQVDILPITVVGNMSIVLAFFNILNRAFLRNCFFDFLSKFYAEHYCFF